MHLELERLEITPKAVSGIIQLFARTNSAPRIRDTCRSARPPIRRRSTFIRRLLRKSNRMEVMPSWVGSFVNSRECT